MHTTTRAVGSLGSKQLLCKALTNTRFEHNLNGNYVGWNYYLQSYYNYLRLEKGLSTNTLAAYRTDILRYLMYVETELGLTEPGHIQVQDIRAFLGYLADYCGLNELSQARNISSIRSFHQFLLQENYLQDNPAELIDLPRVQRKLPDVISLDEINQILDVCAPEKITEEEKMGGGDALGVRNRAMLELMYSSGLRVSELVSLRLDQLYLDDGIVRVVGKGNKERLIPLGSSAIDQIKRYSNYHRMKVKARPGNDPILFLNRRGAKLTRNMVFMIIKKACEQVGVYKTVSPHTFRHSFATHLIEGGADLIAVKEMLGHESVTTTEIYLHTNGHYLREVHASFHPRA